MARLTGLFDARMKWIFRCSCGLATLLLLGSLLYVLYVHVLQGSVVYTAPPRVPRVEVAPPLSEVRMSEELVFTGDVMLGRHVELLSGRNGTAYITNMIADFLNAEERVVITNFESAMATPHRPSPSGSFQFSTHPDTLAVLSEINTSYASLANNHALDYGNTGYETASSSLAVLGITSFGHPTAIDGRSITYIESTDYTIGLLGIHTLFNEPNKVAIAAALAEMSAQSDFQVAYVHWGVEYELVHARKQAELVSTLAAAGIDLVVGHHPHVTQDIQIVDGIPVFYSLGNFIFDQYFSKNVQEGYLLGITFVDDMVEYRLYPHTSAAARSQPALMSDGLSGEYLTALAARSDERLAEGIVAAAFSLPLPAQ